MTVSFSWRTVLRWVARLLGGLVALQAAFVTFLTLNNRLRKRRVLTRSFPVSARTTLHVVDNDIRVYTNGDDIYPEMLHAIEAARETIYIETFIWKGDELGQAFQQRLNERAEAGVAVYVIYDTFANWVVPQRFFRGFASAVHVLPYTSWRYPWHFFNLRRYGFDHRKILVVDNEVAFVGGYNIGEIYRRSWRDTHLRLAGPAACDLAHAFVDFWNERRPADQPELPLPTRPWSAQVRIHRNDPLRLNFPIRSIYLEALEHAQRRISLTNAYFVPDRALLQAIMRAAERGVEVRLLVPWRSNQILVDWLARSSFTRLLRVGVQIYLYEDTMIHAKTATIDGVWSFVGTANMDVLSMAVNHEINVEVFDEGLAEELEAVFAEDIRHSRALTQEGWAARPLWKKVGEGLLAPLWPFA